MWEALFVTTFQNKDNLLIYTKTICKSSNKMQKNIISLFCSIIFLQTRKNSHTTQLFYLSIYLFVLQLTSQKVIYSAYRKKSSFYLPSLILSFFFQTRKKKKTKCKFIYFELCVSQVFSFWQNKHYVKYKYWLLILKQFTCVSFYSISLGPNRYCSVRELP